MTLNRSDDGKVKKKKIHSPEALHELQSVFIVFEQHGRRVVHTLRWELHRYASKRHMYDIMNYIVNDLTVHNMSFYTIRY